MKRYLLITILFFFSLIWKGGREASAQYTKLLDFAGTSNGGGPSGSLISDGTFLYGMTPGGGTDGTGVAFKIKPDGTGYVKLLDFIGTNGRYPAGNLIFDGTFLYGMAWAIGGKGNGVIFKIKPDGTGYNQLHDFDGNGAYPYGSLIFDSTYLYGMTWGDSTGNGVVFKIKPDGTGFTILLQFDGSPKGANPYGSLISDGTFLYGMTNEGGTDDDGVIFKIKPDGTGYVKLLNFYGSNGSTPGGSLIADGTFLYGMTKYGGINNNGVIFKIKPDGTGYSKLHNFDDTNGERPLYGDLISDGTFLYGMTQYGGTNNMGVIFKIKFNGTGYTKLLDFAGVSNGMYPQGSLIFDGTFFYGMTAGGGTNNYGTVFKFQDTTNVIDTCFITVYDSVTVNDTATVNDTITFNDTITTNIFDTTFVFVNDTTLITVNDTIIFNDSITINIFDTTFVTVNDTITTFISVTDTLFINAVLTGVNPPNNINILKVYPNPANTHIVIDNGNYSAMNAYKIRIDNALGQTVFQSLIMQQQFDIDLSGWTGKGTYFIYIIDNNSITIDTRKIILK